MKYLRPIWMDSEKRISLLASAFLFSILTAFILLRSARDAFFLSSYSSRMLPYAMTLNTAVSALTALIYLRVYRYFSLARVIRVSFLIFISGTILIWKGLGMHIPRIAGLLYIWVGIFGTIAPVQGWALVALQFSTRQARRLMGLLGGGAVSGAVAGGIIARSLARHHSVGLLLPSAALFIFIALIVCLALSPPQTKREEKPATTAVEIPRNFRGFALLLLLIVAIGTVVSAFIDFEFKTIAQRQMHSANSLAAFFGSFYAYMGAGTLLFQLIGTPFLMRRLGIAATLAILPLSLLIGDSLVFAAGLFRSTLLMRGSEELFRYSVDRSSLEVLYVAIPESAKVRLKSIIDTIGVRLPEGLASIFLIVLFSVGHSSVHFLFLINGGLLFSWLACVLFLGKREYPRLLKEEIQRKEIDLDSIKSGLFNLDFYRILPQLFQNGEKETVLDLLELLETSGKRWIGSYIGVALNRGEREVRLKALRMLFYQDANLSGSILHLLNDSDPALRTEAIHYVCLRSGRPPKEYESWITSEVLPLRVAAAAALFRTPKTAPAGYHALENLRSLSLKRGDEEARKEICHVLEFVRPANESIELYEKLIADPSLEIRRSAIRSIAVSRPLEIIPVLMRLMALPALSNDLRIALAAYGSVLLPQLTKVLEDPSERVFRKKMALRIAADIGAARALPFILATARQGNPALRFEAIKALNRLNKQQAAFHPPKVSIRRLLMEEIDQLNLDVKRVRDFSPRADGLLANVLRQRYFWSVERSFRLIGLLHPEQSSIYYTYLAWTSSDSRLSDAALDFLEEQVDPEVKGKLVGLLEQFPEGNHVEDEELRKEAAFHWMAQNEPLLTAAVIADLTDTEIQVWGNEIEDRLKLQKHPLVAEILNRRNQKMEMQRSGNESQPLSTIEKMEHLGKIDVFSRLGSHELLLLADQASEVHFAKGERIFNEGEIASEAYSLLEGKVILERGSKRLSTVGPGESFGTLELLSNQPRLFSAIAAQDAYCLKIETEVFWEILEDYPAVSRSILQVLVQQIRALTDKIADSLTV